MGAKAKTKTQALCADKDPGAILNILLGRSGRLVSMSKSCGPAMAIYNSNVVVNNQVVWHGDVDLDADGPLLRRIAELIGAHIDVYYESHLRVFPFEVKDEKEMRKKHKEKMKKVKPTWSTSTPDMFDGKSYEKIRERMSAVRQERILERQIAYGFLTPGGTEWAWYNTWFYRGPYRIYAYLRDRYKIYISYPVYFVKMSDEKLTRWQKVKEFLAAVRREWNYRHGKKENN